MILYMKKIGKRNTILHTPRYNKRIKVMIKLAINMLTKIGNDNKMLTIFVVIDTKLIYFHMQIAKKKASKTKGFIPIWTQNSSRNLQFPSKRPPWSAHQLSGLNNIIPFFIFKISFFWPYCIAITIGTLGFKEPPVVIKISGLASRQH